MQEHIKTSNCVKKFGRYITLALDTSSVEAIDTEFEATFYYEKRNFPFCFDEISTQGTNPKSKLNRFVDFHNN